jgi:hypothetical protein
MQKNETAAAIPVEVARLMDGYLVTQLLYVAAKLGIGDSLADEPRTADSLAQDLGVEADALRRVMRGLAAEGILDERPGGRFELTAAGACLCGETRGSLKGAIIARGELYYGAAAGLLDCVRHGGSAFEKVHGKRFFEYLAEDACRSATFQGSMADRSRHEAAAVVAAFDFKIYRHLIDVGGGEGILLAAILAAAPQLRAVLMDQAPAIERAKPRLQTAGLADRCEFVAGDIFGAIPAGGDVYLLSRVLHNWGDEAAIAILANCRRAMGQAGALLLVEAVLPERAVENGAAIRMDLHMLALLQGRERTVREYEGLLDAAGYRMTRVARTSSPSGIAIIEATASDPD